MEDQRLLIGDLSEQTGVAASALRYYEASGLLRAEARTESGYRIYGGRAARRLGFIRRAKEVGFRLSEIKRLVDVPPAAREDELAYFNRVVALKIQETNSRIAQLRAAKRELRRLESALAGQPPPATCHVGDCACWLPAA